MRKNLIIKNLTDAKKIGISQSIVVGVVNSGKEVIERQRDRETERQRDRLSNRKRNCKTRT
jgi:hypothetical protein